MKIHNRKKQKEKREKPMWSESHSLTAHSAALHARCAAHCSSPFSFFYFPSTATMWASFVSLPRCVYVPPLRTRADESLLCGPRYAAATLISFVLRSRHLPVGPHRQAHLLP
jgi:hypothetical protein